jgi:hypothetical protein
LQGAFADDRSTCVIHQLLSGPHPVRGERVRINELLPQTKIGRISAKSDGCPHGAKHCSLIAASYFNQIAAERHLSFTAVAVAAEDHYKSVPVPIADFLEKDGFDVCAFKPRPVTSTDLRSESKIIFVAAI